VSWGGRRILKESKRGGSPAAPKESLFLRSESAETNNGNRSRRETGRGDTSQSLS
jgi:hypothetical protein